MSYTVCELNIFDDQRSSSVIFVVHLILIVRTLIRKLLEEECPDEDTPDEDIPEQVHWIIA